MDTTLLEERRAAALRTIQLAKGGEGAKGAAAFVAQTDEEIAEATCRRMYERAESNWNDASQVVTTKALLRAFRLVVEGKYVVENSHMRGWQTWEIPAALCRQKDGTGVIMLSNIAFARGPMTDAILAEMIALDVLPSFVGGDDWPWFSSPRRTRVVAEVARRIASRIAGKDLSHDECGTEPGYWGRRMRDVIGKLRTECPGVLRGNRKERRKKQRVNRQYPSGWRSDAMRVMGLEIEVRDLEQRAVGVVS